MLNSMGVERNPRTARLLGAYVLGVLGPAEDARACGHLQVPGPGGRTP